jgi:hypothetical protein
LQKIENGGGGSVEVTRLQHFSPKIQGKIVGKARKNGPSGHLSQDLRAFCGESATEFRPN